LAAGLRPDPLGELKRSLSAPPDLLAAVKGLEPPGRGGQREGEVKEGMGERREGKVREGKGEGMGTEGKGEERGGDGKGSTILFKN